MNENQVGRFIQPDKIYHGWRDCSPGLIMHGKLSGGAGLTFVTVNGQPLRAWNFGEADFFEWGYNGTGPRMLTLALLADYFQETPTLEEYEQLEGKENHEETNTFLQCLQYFHSFLSCIENMEHDSSWTLSSDHIRIWIKQRDQFLQEARENLARQLVQPDTPS